MIPENINPNNALVERGIRGLNQGVVQVLLIFQRVKPLEHKLEKRVQIFGTRTGHKDVGVPERDRRRHRQTQGRRFAPPSCGRQRNGRSKLQNTQ